MMFKLRIAPLFCAALFFLQGCASSDMSRNAATSIDNLHYGTQSSLSQAGNGSVVDTYQNTSQTTKGVMIGGVTGGVVGGLTHGVGAVSGVIIGGILGGALGAYIDAHTTLVDKLENRGVKVFVLGDQVMIVIPSNRLFDGTTPRIRNTSYSTLDLVAQLIGNYTNITVKVSAYTNATGPAAVDLALSQQQAERVARYLWKRGVNTRLLYAEGYGGTNLVAKNSLDWSESDNYRVEITFEKLPT